jgi:hypothetical protein
MVRISLIAAATFATIVTANSAFAQATAPVRTLNPSATADASTISTSERKPVPCADKSCAGRPLKRGYVAAAPLGW